MMDSVLRISLSVLRSVIIVIGAVLCIMIVAKSGSEEMYVEGMANYGTLLNIVYWMTIVVGLLCAAAAVIFGIIFFFSNIKKNMGMLVGITAFVVLALISTFVLADGSINDAWRVDGGVTTTESLLGGGGIMLSYLLGAIALGAIAWTEVSRFFK
ncbi:MAG: magnesium-transporting ATPase (P-type) [Flavobacteriales bacterium]|jgi:hypothetical protein